MSSSSLLVTGTELEMLEELLTICLRVMLTYTAKSLNHVDIARKRFGTTNLPQWVGYRRTRRGLVEARPSGNRIVRV